MMKLKEHPRAAILTGFIGHVPVTLLSPTALTIITVVVLLPLLVCV
jgi:hypothetical protein